MATVRQSIMALYAQSQKSAGEGQAMFAVIESEAVAPAKTTTAKTTTAKTTTDIYFDIPASDGRPLIARRFDDLRALAEREMSDEAGPDTISSLADDRPETADVSGVEADIGPAAGGAINTHSETVAPDMPLPSEPPAPAGGDPLSDLDIGDIQELVRQAWEDESALGAAVGKAAHTGADPIGHDAHDDAELGTGDDPDIKTAMEKIAAAIGQNGDGQNGDGQSGDGQSGDGQDGDILKADAPDAKAQVPVDLTSVKVEIMAAMRTELQAVVKADLGPMIKAAIAEALQELSAAPPEAGTKTRAKKAVSGKTAKKGAAARAKKGAAAKKPDD